MSRNKNHNPDYSQGKGNFRISYHFEMVSDYERISQFKAGIEKIINEGLTFCDLGCGTGVFSIYAARKAKKVYAVEFDEKIFGIAKKNIENSIFSEKITIIYGDASTVVLPEKVDVVLCEMLSTWMIEEPQVLVMNHARGNLLKAEGATIPKKIVNLAELCNMDYKFDNIEIKAPITQFTGVKHPRIMSESKMVNSISFDTMNPIIMENQTGFKALTSGIINSVRISSIVKIVEGINFYSTDTLMPLTVVPLKDEIYVEEGENLLLITKYAHRDSLANTQFEIKII